uniref:Zinc finger PHD-type domain-containing protein n=1 Tax=Spumella elongata TaxID=89044 RepID=A0A7S3HHK6_9STRA|mmetsp:Transcript_53143/g.92725  ORF Transcript_53143/g.92725 Transcript_53143/m.92725 type:complete len:203 (+) Transcript_53143:885-1493(+)
MRDISSQWILQSSSRQRQSRLEQVHVANVGLVSVLKANNYTLEQGESSIFEKEALRHKQWAFGGANKKGKKFEHQDYCQYCWNYGSLICCAYCPASYHLQCVDLKAVPCAMWSCPHHAGCVTCGRRGAAAGFLFRCETCPNSYCEDCLPAEHHFVGECKRWAELGYATRVAPASFIAPLTVPSLPCSRCITLRLRRRLVVVQ